MSNFNVEKKYFKHGGFSIAITLIVLVALVAVNIGVNALSSNVGLSFDMSSNQLFSLSDQSKKLLDKLDKKVTIYALFSSSSTSLAVPTEKEILEKYAAKSSNISLVYKDPNLYPQFATKYITDNSGAPEGTLIVEYKNKFKLIRPSDMVNSTTDENTQQTSVTSFIAEQKITNAIAYVSSDKSPVIYQLSGQSEGALDSTVASKITDENFTLKSIDLLTDKLIADPNSILLINTPTRDLSDQAYKSIKAYLDNGGNAYFMVDLYSHKLNAPNFEALLKSYGVKIVKAMIVEGDTNHMYQSPIYLLPELAYNDITNPLTQQSVKVIVPGSQGIQNIKAENKSANYQALLTTSANSWGKTSLEPKSVEKAKGDPEGPFDLAATVSMKGKSGKTSKIVVVSNAYFLNSQLISASSNANLDFFMNSLSYLANEKQNISIRPKDVQSTTVVMDQFTSMLVAALAVIIIPAIIIIFGIVVWLRRRKL